MSLGHGIFSKRLFIFSHATRKPTCLKLDQKVLWISLLLYRLDVKLIYSELIHWQQYAFLMPYQVGQDRFRRHSFHPTCWACGPMWCTKRVNQHTVATALLLSFCKLPTFEHRTATPQQSTIPTFSAIRDRGHSVFFLRRAMLAFDGIFCTKALKLLLHCCSLFTLVYMIIFLPVGSSKPSTTAPQRLFQKQHLVTLFARTPLQNLRRLSSPRNSWRRHIWRSSYWVHMRRVQEVTWNILCVFRNRKYGEPWLVAPESAE